jgi:hypothetical protein
MNHFDIADWTDFARGCVAAPDRAPMQAHLDGGCRRCRATVDMLQRVVAAVRAAEALSEPPADIVRCAKAISALQRPRTATGGWSVARLIYDSLREPLPAGMRAQTPTSRHAVFEAGGLFIDLRLEREQAQMRLVGQLTQRDDPTQFPTASPVLLLTRRDVVAHAVSNQFGEFQMEYPPARDLRLCIALPDPASRVEVSLNQIAGDQPAPKRVRGSRPKSA